jgi:hypothetical protein
VHPLLLSIFSSLMPVCHSHVNWMLSTHMLTVEELNIPHILM